MLWIQIFVVAVVVVCGLYESFISENDLWRNNSKSVVATFFGFEKVNQFFLLFKWKLNNIFTLSCYSAVVVLSFVVDGVFGVCVIDVAVSCVGLANVLDLSMIVVLWCEREIVWSNSKALKESYLSRSNTH